MKFGKPRGGHRGGELLVRLSRRRRLHEPRHEQLREPSRVLRPNPRQEVPHARRQTLRVTGTVPVTRSRTGSRRESPDGVHLPGQRAKLRVQRVARLLAIMVRLLGIRGGAEPGGDEPGGDEPGDASDAAGRRGTRRRHERRGEKHADAAAVAGTREIQSFGASKRGETTRERLSRRGRVSSKRGRTDQRR